MASGLILSTMNLHFFTVFARSVPRNVWTVQPTQTVLGREIVLSRIAAFIAKANVNGFATDPLRMISRACSGSLLTLPFRTPSFQRGPFENRLLIKMFKRPTIRMCASTTNEFITHLAYLKRIFFHLFIWAFSASIAPIVVTWLCYHEHWWFEAS